MRSTTSSNSLIRWNGERADALDEIENAHVMIGGSERGRRYATQQINYSYVTLLSSHFQGFCRDLHSECIEHIVAIVPAPIQRFLRIEFLWNRSLERGNPHAGAMGSDFGRLGVGFWRRVDQLDARNEQRRAMLQELIAWRNAIVHQDFDAVATGSAPSLHVATVRAWRRALNLLTRYFDKAMYNYLQTIIGKLPW